jgi:hypothetical protein
MSATKPDDVLQQLTPPRALLVDAVVEAVRIHVAGLRERGVAFYGYALLCNEADGMIEQDSLAWISPVYNTEADLAAHAGEEDPDFYRYCVDEWAHFSGSEPGFDHAASRLHGLNAAFRELHPDDKPEDDYDLDAFEVAHADLVYHSILDGLAQARALGVFGAPPPFLAVWVSDSAAEIVAESVRRLNGRDVVETWDRVFRD